MSANLAMLSGFQGGPGLRVVHIRRRADDDGLQAFYGKDLFHCGAGDGHFEIPRYPSGSLTISLLDRDEFGAGMVLQGGHVRGDTPPAGPDNGTPDSGFGTHDLTSCSCRR